MEIATFKLEHEYDGVGAGWTDETPNVLSMFGITWQDGIQSYSPVNLLANPGNIQYVLDNAPSNNGGKYGYFTPGHANCRSGFAKNIRVRYSLTYGGTTYYQNVYWMKKPIPTAGMFGEGVTRCKATDWLDLAMNTPMPAIGVQTNKTGDQLLTSLLALVATQPISTSFATGDSAFVSSMDKDDTSKDSLYNAIAKICRSEFGMAYLQSDTTGGGKLVFLNRNGRAGNLASLGTISNVMDGVEILDDAGEVYDQVRVTITPKRKDVANVELAKLQTILQISPNEEVPFNLSYRDPNGGNKCSGDSIAAQVAGTDYKFGSTNDGSSQDLNANLQITINSPVGANSIAGKLKNIGTTTGYVNLFRFQGLGIYSYDVYTIEVGVAGLRVMTFDMPYQTNINVANSVANFLKGLVSDNARRGARVTLHANKSAALMNAALTGNISTRWTLEEYQTGLAADWFVNGRKGKMGMGGQFDMDWMVVPASGQEVWVLGSSALGTNTRLAV